MASACNGGRRSIGARWLGGLALVVLPTWMCLAAETDPKTNGLSDADRALLAETEQFSRRGTLGGRTDGKEFLVLREKLRKRFPVESLADRLAYEGCRREALVAERKERTGGLQLVENLEKAIDEPSGLGRQPFFGRFAVRRSAVLAKLHGDNVEAFANAAGFGNLRMAAFPLDRLFVKSNRIPFESGPSLSSADDSGPLDLPREGGVRAGPAPRWPALPALGDFHFRVSFDFVDPIGLGDVQDREHVVGFAAHRFLQLPQVDPTPVLPEEKAKEHWAVRRLELVSLLKEEKPAVYVSDHLPSMNDLKGVERRPLGTFEEDSLPKLRKGENLVAEATTNRIVMLGAVRAAKQCLKCHEVERGDLLGAFSYELQRDPLVQPAK